MNIVFSSDDKYIRHIYVSMMSLFESQKKENHLNIYLIDNNICEENKNILNSLAGRYKNLITFLPFDKIEKKLSGVALWGGSLSPYARLFLCEYLNHDKVLYLDGDSTIHGDLVPLFEMDISDYYFAAVQDTAGPVYRNEVGICADDKYINSGFLLVNLKKWHEDHIQDKFLNFIERFNGKVPCCDQGVLNGVCKGKILVLHPKYNVMTPMFAFKAKEIEKFFEISEYYTQREIDEAKEQPVFIHYVGGFYVRPWFKNTNHPKKEMYLKYMEQSPWKGDFFQNENFSMRSKLMIAAHKYLPFFLFVSLHRVTRNVKRAVLKKGN